MDGNISISGTFDGTGSSCGVAAADDGRGTVDDGLRQWKAFTSPMEGFWSDSKGGAGAGNICSGGKRSRSRQCAVTTSAGVQVGTPGAISEQDLGEERRLYLQWRRRRLEEVVEQLQRQLASVSAALSSERRPEARRQLAQEERIVTRRLRTRQQQQRELAEAFAKELDDQQQQHRGTYLPPLGSEPERATSDRPTGVTSAAAAGADSWAPPYRLGALLGYARANQTAASAAASSPAQVPEDQRISANTASAWVSELIRNAWVNHAAPPLATDSMKATGGHDLGQTAAVAAVADSIGLEMNASPAAAGHTIGDQRRSSAADKAADSRPPTTTTRLPPIERSGGGGSREAFLPRAASKAGGGAAQFVVDTVAEDSGRSQHQESSDATPSTEKSYVVAPEALADGSVAATAAAGTAAAKAAAAAGRRETRECRGRCPLSESAQPAKAAAESTSGTTASARDQGRSPERRGSHRRRKKRRDGDYSQRSDSEGRSRQRRRNRPSTATRSSSSGGGRGGRDSRSARRRRFKKGVSGAPKHGHLRQRSTSAAEEQPGIKGKQRSDEKKTTDHYDWKKRCSEKRAPAAGGGAPRRHAAIAEDSQGGVLATTMDAGAHAASPRGGGGGGGRRSRLRSSRHRSDSDDQSAAADSSEAGRVATPHGVTSESNDDSSAPPPTAFAKAKVARAGMSKFLRSQQRMAAVNIYLCVQRSPRNSLPFKSPTSARNTRCLKSAPVAIWLDV